MELYLGSGFCIPLKLIIKINRDQMQAFAVIRLEPIRCRTISLSFEQQLHARLEIPAIKQPNPTRNIIHIIDAKRKLHYPQNETHLLPVSPVKPQQVPSMAQECQKLEKTPETNLKAQRKKPIFQKSNAPINEEISSSMSTIKLNSSTQEIQEESMNYFNATHRKMKGQDKPYAQTSRTKDFQFSIRKQVSKNQAIESRSVRRKLFSDSKNQKTGQKQSIEVIQNKQHQFRKKKPIFMHNYQDKDRLVESHIIEVKPEQEQAKKQAKQTPKIIKLRPRASLKVAGPSDHQSSNTSLSAYSYHPLAPFVL